MGSLLAVEAEYYLINLDTKHWYKDQEYYEENVLRSV